MSEGLNKVQLIGNVGIDPEVRYGQSGGAILRLRIATTERYMNRDKERQERTEWHTVVMFGNRAEGLGKHVEKGTKLYVEGRLQTKQWEDRDGNKRWTTEIVGTQVLFLGGKGNGGGQRQQSGGGYNQRPAQGGGFDAPPPNGEDDYGGAFDQDDIPFSKYDERLA